MILFGYDIRRDGISKASKPKEPGGDLPRPASPQGPYTALFNDFMARKVQPELYEALKESIPVIDTAIQKLTTLDGMIKVEGNNKALVAEIEDWMGAVQVNDLEMGFQSFINNYTNETHEQGFSISEFVFNRNRTDIVRLNVADSKDIRFERATGGLNIWYRGQSDPAKSRNSTDQVGDVLHGTLPKELAGGALTGNWKKLRPDNLAYYSIGNENHNPYGVSIMRSMEFVSKILLTIENGTLNSWERFGDPSYSITYKCGKRELGASTLEERRKALSTSFSSMLDAKRQGQSADFVQAVDQNSEIKISVIGADGQVLELEAPTRHVLEQLIAKTGLPPWIFGFHWSTTERLAKHQAELMLQEAETRGKNKLPRLTQIVSTMLRLRGRTWKRDDWSLEFERPNLHDLVAQAQARFLNAQADMYDRGDTQTTSAPDKSTDKEPEKDKAKAKHICKETRPIAMPALDSVESDYLDTLKGRWSLLAERVLVILKLREGKSVKAPEDKFRFTEAQRTQIFKSMENWIGEWKPGKDAAETLKWYYGQAYSIGLLQMAGMVGQERPILDIITNDGIYKDLVNNGFTLVKDNATHIIKNRLLTELEAQVIAGTNPMHVANRVAGIFRDANTNWERLVRSEMTMAAERAKKDEAKAEGVTKMEFVTAPDACPICLALKGTYDIGKVPLPVADTHPRCYCTTVAIIE